MNVQTDHSITTIPPPPQIYLIVCSLTRLPQSQITDTNGPRRWKTCLQGFANNKGADQHSHPRSLIRAVVIRLLETIIYRLATSEISIF